MLKVENLYKSFGEPKVDVLKGISFEIKDKTFVSITGRSGSGKSTLLYTISTLDAPTSGSVYLNNEDIAKMSEENIHKFRNLKMGFIFQFHFLLPELTALENVLMPARKTNQHIKLETKAKDLLESVGLKDKFDRLPKHLSGGEQQRVAIARSLIMDPQFIFADEPTGNLDSTNGDIVMATLKAVTREKGTSVIYVTHDADYANLADQQIHLQDGKLV